MQVTVIFLWVLASLVIAAPQQGGYDYPAPQSGGVTGAFSDARQQQTGGATSGVRQKPGATAQGPGFSQTSGFSQDGLPDSFGAEIAQGPGGAVFIDSTTGARSSTEKFQVSPGSGEVGQDNSRLSGIQVGRPLAAASGGFGATSSGQGSGTRGFGSTGSQPSAFSSGSSEISFVGSSGQGSREIGFAGQQPQGVQYGGGVGAQRGQISGHVAGVRGQTSGTRDQGTEIQGQGAGTRDQGTGIQSQGAGVSGQVTGIRGQGAGFTSQGIEIQGPSALFFGQGVGSGEQGQFIRGGQSLEVGGFEAEGGVEFGDRGEQVSQAGQQFSGVGQGVLGQGPGVSGLGFQEVIGGVQSTGGAAGTSTGVRGGQPPAPFGDDLAAPAEYNFKWDVTDPESGNFYGHEEERNGVNTRGRYYVTLPDTRVMTVEYYADETGYHPKITYEGEAQVFETVRQQGRGQQAAVTGQATQGEQQNQFQSQGSAEGLLGQAGNFQSLGETGELQGQAVDFQGQAQTGVFQGQAGDFQGQELTGGFEGQAGDIQGQAQLGEFQGQAGDFQGQGVTGGFQGQAGDFPGQAHAGGIQGQTGDFQGSPGDFVGQIAGGLQEQRQTGAAFNGQAQTSEFLAQGQETGTGYQEPGQAQTGGFHRQAQTGGSQGQELTGAGIGQGAISGFRGQEAPGGLQGQGAFSGVQSQGSTGTLQRQGFGFGTGSQETGIGGFQEPHEVGSFQSSGEFIDSSTGFSSTGLSGKPFLAGSSNEIPASGEITTFGSRAPSTVPVQPLLSGIRIPALASVAASGYTAPLNRGTGRPSLTKTQTSASTGAFSQQNIGVPLPGLQSQASLEGQQQFGLQPQQQFTGSAASQEQFGNFRPSEAQQQQPGLQTSQHSSSGLFTTQQQLPAFPTAQQQGSSLQSSRQPQGQLPFGFQSNQQTPVAQDRTVEQPSQLYQAPNDQPGVNRLTQQAGTGQTTQQQPNLFQQQQTLQSTGFSGEQTGFQFTPQQSRPFQQQQGVQNIASSAEQSGFPQQPNTFIQQQGILSLGPSIEQSGSQLIQPGSFQQQQGIQSTGSSGELSASQFAQQQPGPFLQPQTLQNVSPGGQSIEQEYKEPAVQDFGNQSFQSGQGQVVQNLKTVGTIGVPSGVPHTSGQRIQNQLDGGSTVQSASGEVVSAVTQVLQRPSQLYGPPQG